ncbi:hypothetical protein GGR53DRAFT_527142 [Hypoxylon sp. FL1150]|nr:hypothetical protein GGR53DRAFT_527142 [Hypoxylon sp. FL1150]
MDGSNENIHDHQSAELSRRRTLDSHVETYYREGRGINYFAMLLKLPLDQMTKVHDIFKQHYPPDCPRIESYSNFFQLVDRLDRDRANEVLDIINGFHVYGGAEPKADPKTKPDDNDEKSNSQILAAASAPTNAAATTPSSSTSSATSPAARYTRTVETDFSEPGHHEHATVTYTVRGSPHGPTAVVTGLPDDTNVPPARVAQAMEAVSQIMGGLHHLVSLALRKER